MARLGKHYENATDVLLFEKNWLQEYPTVICEHGCSFLKVLG